MDSVREGLAVGRAKHETRGGTSGLPATFASAEDAMFSKEVVAGEADGSACRARPFGRSPGLLFQMRQYKASTDVNA